MVTRTSLAFGSGMLLQPTRGRTAVVAQVVSQVVAQVVAQVVSQVVSRVAARVVAREVARVMARVVARVVAQVVARVAAAATNKAGVPLTPISASCQNLPGLWSPSLHIE